MLCQQNASIWPGKALVDEDADACRPAHGIDDRQLGITPAIRHPALRAPAGSIRQRLAIGKPAERRAAALQFQHQRRKIAAPLPKIDMGALGRIDDLGRRLARRTRRAARWSLTANGAG